MTIKLGLIDINKNYVGDTEIKKAYLGDTLIYDKTGGGVLPPIDPTKLETWFDVSDPSSIIENAGSISQWSDKSGKGNHATQTYTSSATYI